MSFSLPSNSRRPLRVPRNPWKKGEVLAILPILQFWVFSPFQHKPTQYKTLDEGGVGVQGCHIPGESISLPPSSLLVNPPCPQPGRAAQHIPRPGLPCCCCPQQNSTRAGTRHHQPALSSSFRPLCLGVKEVSGGGGSFQSLHPIQTSKPTHQGKQRQNHIGASSHFDSALGDIWGCLERRLASGPSLCVSLKPSPTGKGGCLMCRSSEAVQGPLTALSVVLGCFNQDLGLTPKEKGQSSSFPPRQGLGGVHEQRDKSDLTHPTLL